MDSAENIKDVAERWMEEIWRKRNLAVFMTFTLRTSKTEVLPGARQTERVIGKVLSTFSPLP